jgi:protein-disulfide isomerase
VSRLGRSAPRIGMPAFGTCQRRPPGKLTYLLPLLALVVSHGGLFAAGVLSLGSLLDLPVPCGRSRDCQAVAADPASELFGVPIALYGVATYVVIMFLLNRAVVARWPRIACVALAGLGTVTSAALLIYSRSGLHATCPWCIASGAAMALLLVLSIPLLRSTQPWPAFRPALFWGLALVTAAALGVQAGLMQRTAFAPPIPALRLAGVTAAELVDPAKSLGPEGAPVTIVMFADMWCPACRTSHASLIKYQNANPAGIRLVFRHLPFWEIRGHESSRAAGVLGEMAAEKDRFWLFVDLVYRHPSQLDRAGYLRLMGRLGLSPAEVEARLGDSQDAAIVRVLRDVALAERLGVTATPTFIVLVDDNPAVSASHRMLPRILNSPAVLARLAEAAQASRTRE